MLAFVALCLLSGSLQRAEGTRVLLLAARAGAPGLTPVTIVSVSALSPGAQNIALPSPVGQGRRVEHLRIRSYVHSGWNDGPVGAHHLDAYPG